MLKKARLGLMALGALIVLYGVFFFATDLSASKLETADKIDEMMITVAARVDDFQIEQGQYPSALEFVSLRGDLVQYEAVGDSLSYYNGAITEAEVLEEFGEPTTPSYILRVWSDESFEYYAGWAERSSVPKTLSEFYFTGSKIGDTLAYTLLGVLLIMGSWFVGRIV